MSIRKSKNASNNTKSFICPICGNIETFSRHEYNKLSKGMRPDIASAANLYNYILPVCEAHDRLMIGGDSDIFELVKTLFNAGIFVPDIYEGQLSEVESDNSDGKELFFISPYIMLQARKNSFMNYEKINSILSDLLNGSLFSSNVLYMENPGVDGPSDDHIDNHRFLIAYRPEFPNGKSERTQRREFKKCKEAFSDLVFNLTNAIKSEAGYGCMLMHPISDILN